MIDQDVGSSPLREARLQADLAVAVERLTGLFCGPDAILLYGGYGRGEGSWIETNGSWRPYNDYDLLVVGGSKIGKEVIKEASEELADLFGLRWVDITWFPRWRLRFLRSSIFSYDLRHGTRLVSGEPEIFREIRSPEAGAIPVREILDLFITRLWTFLGSTGPEGISQSLAGDCSRFFRNQMAKAVLASVDALLVTEGLYHVSYRIRVERACALAFPTLSERKSFRWALQEKLRPRSPDMSQEEVVKLFDKVYALYERIMSHSLKPYFGSPLTDIKDIAHAYESGWQSRLQRLLWRTLGVRSGYDQQLVNLAQMYFLAAYNPGKEIDQCSLRRGKRLLQRFDSGLGVEMDWDVARVLAAEARMKV